MSWQLSPRPRPRSFSRARSSTCRRNRSPRPSPRRWSPGARRRNTVAVTVARCGTDSPVRCSCRARHGAARPRPAPVSVPRSTVQAPPAPAPPSPPGQVPAPRRPAEAPWRPRGARRGRHATGEAGRTRGGASLSFRRPLRKARAAGTEARQTIRLVPGRHRDPQVQEAQESRRRAGWRTAGASTPAASRSPI